MISKADITRLRQSTSDDVLYNYLYENDGDFKSAVDRVKPGLENASPLVKMRFPTAIINRHYTGSWESKTSNPLTAQIATSAAEKALPVPTQPRGMLDPNPVEDASLGGFAGNIFKSATRFLKDLGSVVMHPVETGKNLGKLALGGGINLAEVITQNEDLFNDPFGSETLASGVGQFYADRYGSIEAAQKTAYEDPVGFLSDLATVVSAGGMVLGKVGKLAGASNLSKAGQLVSRTADALDPALVAARAAGGMIKGAAKTLSPGRAAERLVESAVDLKPTDAARVAEQAGVRAGRVILDQGAIGPIGSTADDIADFLTGSAKASKAELDTGLANIPRKFIATEAPRVFEAIDFLANEVKGKLGLEDDLAKLKQFKKQRSLNLSEINEVKRMLDRAEKIFTQSGDVKAGFTAKGLAKVRGAIKEFVELEAGKRGMENVESLNKNTQVARGLSEDIKTTQIGKGKNNVLKITDYLAGTAGAAVGGLPGTVAAFGLNRFLGSQRFKTALAYYLNKLSAESLKKIEQAILGGDYSGEGARILREVIDRAKKDIEGFEVPVAESVVLPERAEDK